MIRLSLVMNMIGAPDIHHLRAAQGWLELGNLVEASAELDNIAPKLRVHPDVLEVRWEIYALAERWKPCLDVAEALVILSPERSVGWLHRSYALHELKRTQEAFDKLVPAVDKFPDSWTIPYNLACYCAQLGRNVEASVWFTKSMAIDLVSARESGIDDPDLQPLWESMSNPLRVSGPHRG